VTAALVGTATGPYRSAAFGRPRTAPVRRRCPDRCAAGFASKASTAEANV